MMRPHRPGTLPQCTPGFPAMHAERAMSTPRNQQSSEAKPAYQMKLAVHERDQYRCLNCRETFDDPSELHMHHIVPRGNAGSTTHTNAASLCDRCHKPIHEGEGFAPTIRWQSTGDMEQKDFIWFRHFWKEMLPALSEAAVADSRIEPYFDDPNRPYKAWHIPLGDVRRLDEILTGRSDVKYSSMQVCSYM